MARLFSCIRALASAALMLGATTSLARASDVLPGLSEAAIDELAAHTQQAFAVPGLAIGIVHDNTVIFSKTYGVRQAGKPDLVDGRTRFAIGSNTKSFTTAALSILDHDGRLKWADPVWTHMPEFAVSDPYLSRAFTIPDLLTHHSGMGLGAGDLMLFSRSRFTRDEVVARLQYMPFTAGFRQQYAYNNLLYVAAGRLIEDVSHDSWEHFVQSNIIDAASMPACTTSPQAPRGGDDRATGHALADGKAVPVAWESLPAVAPAGGIECSLDGMERWVSLLLRHGRIDGRQVLAADEIETLWAPHALLPLPDTAALTQTHFRAYGLGWFMEDFYGQKRVFHTGTIQNMVSYVSFLPDKHLGFVILTNQDDHYATYTLATALSAAALGHMETDWLHVFRQQEDDKNSAARAQASSVGPGSAARPFVTMNAAQQAEYAGVYRDRWRGDVSVRAEGGKLTLTFSKADDLSGVLYALPHDLFVVRWTDRARDGENDAYVQFHRDVNGELRSITMQLLESDFSFDVQDLDLQRVSH